MRRCVRWIIGVILALTVSIYLLILALPHLLSPNDYKTLITELVREKTGRELLIQGDIQLQISPGLDVTLALGKVRLANNALFPNSTFVESEQATMGLSLRPLLLQRRLQMAGITLEGVTLNLLRTKEGLGNWEPLAESPEPTAEAAGETTAVNRGQILPLLQKLVPEGTELDLGRIQLTHASVRYDNRQTGRLIIIKDLKIKTGHLKENGQFPFEAAFNLSHDNKRADKPAIIRSGDMTMQGNATLFLTDPRLLIEALRVKGSLKGQSLPKRGLRVVFSTNSDIQLRPQKVTIKDFSLSHDDISLRGSGTLEDFSSPRFLLSLKVPAGSPRSLLRQLDPSLPILLDTDALSQVSAGLLVKGAMEEVEITDLTVKFDETTITGAIKIRDRINPAYEARIHINHLDLDRYGREKTEALPETEGQQLLAVSNEEQSEASPPIVPVSFLKTLRLQLDLQVDSLKMSGAQLSQVQLRLAGKDGLLQLEPLTAGLYDGGMKLKARMDVTGDVPLIQVNQTINKVRLGPLFRDMSGREDVTGTAHIETDINTRGLSRQELISHLNGTMQFELLNGEIRLLPILQVIRTTAALYRARGETRPAVTSDTAAEGTGFVRLSGTGIIEDGILYNNDLMAASELMQLTGAGEIDLGRGLSDLTLKVFLAPDLVDDEEMGLSEFGTAPIPYTIVGPFSDLRQKADVEEVLSWEREKQPLQALPEHAGQQKKNAATAPVRKGRGAVGD